MQGEEGSDGNQSQGERQPAAPPSISPSAKADDHSSAAQERAAKIGSAGNPIHIRDHLRWRSFGHCPTISQ